MAFYSRQHDYPSSRIGVPRYRGDGIPRHDMSGHIL